MRVLQLLVLIFGLAVITNSQNIDKAILSGTVYDQIGGTIQNAKIIITDKNNKRFETVTNESGVYEIELPFTMYKGNYNIRISLITKYSIRVESRGFRVTEIKNFNFIQPKSRKMQLDIALEVGIIADSL